MLLPERSHACWPEDRLSKLFADLQGPQKPSSIISGEADSTTPSQQSAPVSECCFSAGSRTSVFHVIIPWRLPPPKPGGRGGQALTFFKSMDGGMDGWFQSVSDEELYTFILSCIRWTSGEHVGSCALASVYRSCPIICCCVQVCGRRHLSD